jgi:hypothetical protein
MTKLFKIFQKINFKSITSKFIISNLNLKNAFYFVTKFITLYRVKLIVFIFTIGYSIFFLISFLIIYKCYLYALSELNQQLCANLGQDISNLYKNHPIELYHKGNYSKHYISMIYNNLGIINYNDYIFSTSKDSGYLNIILSHSKMTHDKISSIVFTDIITENTHLFSELGEELMKRLLRLSLPLVTSVGLITGLYLAESLKIIF